MNPWQTHLLWRVQHDPADLLQESLGWYDHAASVVRAVRSLGRRARRPGRSERQLWNQRFDNLERYLAGQLG